MITLNLAYPDKGDIKFNITKFSDSQIQFQLDNSNLIEGEDVLILSRMSWNDLQTIIAAQKALHEAYSHNVSLYIPYLLGARSDRKFKEGQCNYLKDVIGPILNSMEFVNVSVLDPHSDVTEAVIDNFDKGSNLELVEFTLENIYGSVFDAVEKYQLISPDAGSLKKIYDTAEKLEYISEITVCSKHRDISTGKIIRTIVPETELNNWHKDAIIIDDICDGGRTFIEIAKVLKEENKNRKVYLIVTHGIFSAGFKELTQYFDGIYCTNSFSDVGDEWYDGWKTHKTKVKQLNVFDGKL